MTKKPVGRPPKKAVNKPTNIATGGNATSVAIRSDSSQSGTTITRTTDNRQPTVEDMEIDFIQSRSKDLTHSKHAPIIFRAEPVETRSRTAASSASAPSETAAAATPRNRNLERIRTSRQRASKRQKLTPSTALVRNPVVRERGRLEPRITRGNKRTYNETDTSFSELSSARSIPENSDANANANEAVTEGSNADAESTTNAVTNE
jgi:hypothetical protein